MCCLCSIAVIPVRFNPENYTVTEGVDPHAVIFLEALQDHPRFGFNVTVHTENGSAVGEYNYTMINKPAVYTAYFNAI